MRDARVSQDYEQLLSAARRTRDGLRLLARHSRGSRATVARQMTRLFALGRVSRGVAVAAISWNGRARAKRDIVQRRERERESRHREMARKRKERKERQENETGNGRKDPRSRM